MRYNLVQTILVLTALGIVGFAMWEMYIVPFFTNDNSKRLRKESDGESRMEQHRAKVVIEKNPSELTKEDIEVISRFYFKLSDLKKYGENEKDQQKTRIQSSTDSVDIIPIDID